MNYMKHIARILILGIIAAAAAASPAWAANLTPDHTSLSFVTTSNSTAPQQLVFVSDDANSGQAFNVSTQSGGWLFVNASKFTTSPTQTYLTVSVVTTNLAVGVYNGTITL